MVVGNASVSYNEKMRFHCYSRETAIENVAFPFHVQNPPVLTCV